MHTDVLFLLGLDSMDKYKMFADTVRNLLCCPSLQLSIPVFRKLGHVYLDWTKTSHALFTRSELLKMHRGFSHPTNDKLLNLLKLARPHEMNHDTVKTLEGIKRACDNCQRLGPTPLRFKVSLPSMEDVKFGEEASMDLMFLDGKAVLHIIDTATRFSTATFLDAHSSSYGQSVDGIWLAFLETWCTLYTGYPNRLRVDQGSAFTSDRWRNLTDFAGIQLRISGVKAHSSLWIG